MSQSCLTCSQDTQRGRMRCHGCTEDERRMLREIETYCIMLPFFLRPSVTATERRAPGFGSAAPIDLNVLVALDVRSKRWATRLVDVEEDSDEFEDHMVGGRYDVDAEVDEDEPGTSILIELESLARVRREDFERPTPKSPATLCSEIAYLLGIAEDASFEPWVDDHYDTIKTIHTYARSLAKDKPPGPIGQCLKVDCEGWVFWCRDAIVKGEVFDAGRCGKCGEEYIGARLLRVKIREVPKVSMRIIRELPNGATLWHMDPNRGFGWTCPCGSTAQTKGRIGECQSSYDSHFLWDHLWSLLVPEEQREEDDAIAS